MRWVRIVLPALLLVAAAQFPAAGETIYLKSGSRLSGKILEQTEEAVKLEVSTDGGKAVISIDRSRIDRIDKATTFDERLQSADGMLKAGQGPAAEDAYRELMREEPRNVPARIGLSRAMVMNFKYAEALKTLEHYLVLVPTGRNPDVLMALAEQYLYAREYRDARKLAKEAAALHPEDRALQQAADDFAKRVDRVRAGLEQLEERQTKEQAERKQLIEARAKFNKELGNNKEAEEAGQMLVDWTAEAQPRLITSRFAEINVPNDALGAYNLGGPARDLQAKVSKCTLTVKVDETIWLSLYDHQKAIYIYGWYYQLRDRYPRCYPDVLVVVDVDERGRTTEKKLARGTWDGRREWITVDRWTKENRDPTRPVRSVIK
jgi:tetratricopeptide (TPR) repeat protein